MKKCFWCGFNTTADKDLARTDTSFRFADREHVFPEALDGELFVPVGLVCKNCNSSLSTIDEKLKYSCLPFMELYQKSSIIKGKPIGKKRQGEKQIKKEKEVLNIKSTHSDLRIIREKDNKTITYQDFSAKIEEQLYNTNLSKGLHKCAVNSYLHNPSNHINTSDLYDIKEFILNENYINEHQWSYATCQANNNSFVRFSPRYIPILNDGNPQMPGMVLVFPSAIYILGLYPGLINGPRLQEIINTIPKLDDYFASLNFSYKDHYRKLFKFDGISKTTYFSNSCGLDFELFTKPKHEIILPNGEYHPTVICKYCSNKTPLGFALAEEVTDSGSPLNFSLSTTCIHCESSFTCDHGDISVNDSTAPKPYPAA